MAGKASTPQIALHNDQRVQAKRRGGLARATGKTSAVPSRLHQCGRFEKGYPPVYRGSYRAINQAVQMGPDYAGKPPNHLTGHNIESLAQARCSMVLLLVCVTFDLTWAQRQHRLSAIQRLNLGFLVNRQHQRVIRRDQIELNHFNHLHGEMRIVAARCCVRLSSHPAPFSICERVVHFSMR